jgi:excisionase family DNA binding protein
MSHPDPSSATVVEPDEAAVLTIDEAADALRVSRSTVKRLLQQGELVGFRVGLRSVRIPVVDVERYLARRRIGGER